MKIQEYKLIQKYFQNWFNLQTDKYYFYLHKIYKQTIKLLLSFNIKTICFINQFADNFDTLAIADELIKNNINVCYLEDLNDQIICNHISSIYDEKIKNSNYILFKNKKYFDSKKIDLLIVPTLINYDKYGIMWDTNIINFINNFNGYKLGLSLENNKISNDEFQILSNCKYLIKLDKFVLV